MLSEYSNKQQPPNHLPSEQSNEPHCPYSTARQERTLKALTLLLGPETVYATRYLARQGSAVLPLLLSTLHHYPELISPPWPGWPPQYEQCSRLLIHLCQDARLSLDALQICQSTQEPVSVRLAASYTLLRCGDSSGIEVLMNLLANNKTGEVCKATIFILATGPPTHLDPQQHEQLTRLLLTALIDENTEISQLAARTLGSIVHPSTVLLLFPLLATSLPSVQRAALLALEEMAQHKAIRLTLRQQMFSANILPLLQSTSPTVRRQAGYTLAAIGGAYVTAVLGIALQNREHIGQIEAIEALRLLHGVLRHPTREKVVQWLLYVLAQPNAEVQVTALDSLAYLVWQTRTRSKLLASTAICSAINQDGTTLHVGRSTTSTSCPIVVPLAS